MTWLELRAHYAKLFAEVQRREGATQQSVARKGGLKGQNAISKLLTNGKRGPSVETFLRAVEGLGMTVAAFVATLDDVAAEPASTAAQSTTRRINDGAPPTPHTAGSLVISTRIEQGPAHPLDITQFDAIVRAHLETVGRKLGYHQRAGSMEPGQCHDAVADARPTARRRRPRRRDRKIA